MNIDYLKNKIKEEYNDDIGIVIDKRFVTIRVNTLINNIENVIKVFNDNNILYEHVAYYDDALVVLNKSEEDISNLDIYINGSIYLQSLSSMMPPLYLDVKAHEMILDMCAAPGSKTSQIAALSNNNALITACERNKGRLERLKYNLNHLGVTCVNVMNIDSRDLSDDFKFDKIMLDAPCSGSGTLTLKNLDSFKLDDSLLNKITNTQFTLLNKAINLVNKDSYIIYSTCSILKEENEDIINKALKTGKVSLVKLTGKDIEYLNSNIDGVLTIKFSNYYEGFFIALLKKN